MARECELMERDDREENTDDERYGWRRRWSDDEETDERALD
jgi:hypothetical protein